MHRQKFLRAAGFLALLAFLAGRSSITAQAADSDADHQNAQTHSQDPAALTEIVITADRKDSFGADFVQAGTFRNARAIDTPLTIAVVPKALLNAEEAQSILDAARNTAGVTSSQINNVIYSNLAIRGVPADNTTNYRLNGVLPIMNFIDMPMEDKDRLEVLKGASGLFYGFATPAGIVNLVTKRPTEGRFAEASVFGNDFDDVGGSVDLNARWAVSGIRVNGAAESLQNGIHRTNGNRHFVSAAYDFQPTDKLLIQVDGEYIHKSITEPTEWALPAPTNGVTPLPPLQDPAKNLGASWLKAEASEHNLLAHIRYDLSPAWRVSFSSGQSYAVVDRRYSSFSGYNLATGDGAVNLAMTHGTTYDNVIYRGDIAGAFQTGPIDHTLLLGVSESILRVHIPAAVRMRFAQNLYDPVSLPIEPTPPRIIINPSKTTDIGYFALERAAFRDWVQVMVGVRKTDYTNAGTTSVYKTNPTTMSYGVVIKPLKWIGIYGTYIEGLESGGIASQIALNAGQLLPAARSKQKEAGIKVQPLSGLLLTAAYFNIERASAYLNSSDYFVQDGRARYDGVEVSATGELTPNLSIAASGTVLNAKQVSGAASVIGKLIENTARYSGSVFLQYRVPLVHGLSLSAGAFHVGSRAVNATNSAFVPGYTTYDVGAAYSCALFGYETTFNLYAQNVTNVRYWAATGSSLLAEAPPGVVKFSVSTRF